MFHNIAGRQQLFGKDEVWEKSRHREVPYVYIISVPSNI